MSEKKDASTQRHQDEAGYVGSPTTGQMRAVGQRRREAEKKLEHHLAEVQQQEESSPAKGAKDDHDGANDSGDVADIQNEDRLAADDREDLIANQPLAGDAEDGPASAHDKPASEHDK